MKKAFFHLLWISGIALLTLGNSGGGERSALKTKAEMIANASDQNTVSEKTQQASCEPEKRNQQARNSKVNEIICSTVHKIENSGVTPYNIEEYNLEEFSSSSLKVDPKGKIHTQIETIKLSLSSHRKALKNLQEFDVRIEMASPSLRLIQAWIPFHKIITVASLKFVKQIQPRNNRKPII